MTTLSITAAAPPPCGWPLVRSDDATAAPAAALRPANAEAEADADASHAARGFAPSPERAGFGISFTRALCELFAMYHQSCLDRKAERQYQMAAYREFSNTMISEMRAASVKRFIGAMVSSALKIAGGIGGLALAGVGRSTTIFSSMKTGLKNGLKGGMKSVQSLRSARFKMPSARRGGFTLAKAKPRGMLGLEAGRRASWHGEHAGPPSDQQVVLRSMKRRGSDASRASEHAADDIDVGEVGQLSRRSSCSSEASATEAENAASASDSYSRTMQLQQIGMAVQQLSSGAADAVNGSCEFLAVKNDANKQDASCSADLSQTARQVSTEDLEETRGQISSLIDISKTLFRERSVLNA